MVVALAVGWSLSLIWGEQLQMYWMIVAAFACFSIYVCSVQNSTELGDLYAAWTERADDDGPDLNMIGINDLHLCFSLQSC